MNRLLRSRESWGVGAGLTIGLLLSAQPWLLLTIGFALGLLAGGLWRAWRDVLAAFRLWSRQRAKEQPIPSGPVPVYPRPRQTDDIPF